ncbi:ABC transporter substrate-binding protein [Aquibacillus koreensis]|uniref:ABC transporter substrate-binding protein n=1 Tax=Aquibacillus koreensis TaxID=279446 RepID=A0A9X3WJ11_9BACI|nr:ABC transporter substrate-binding protein [Aquibacillus koreensis]MCT2536070.1 ABC transporter substrate-binding protein [Aquibacillus koreensis]MDC3419493.1 ABC transporter substrate-binding protein [Aquibacillus koreensis]
MNKKTWYTSIVTLLIVSFMLIGCSNDNANSETDNGETKASKEEKVLIYGRGGDTVSLDPAVVNDGQSYKVIQNIYDTLVRYGDMDTDITAGLADDWNISDDGLTYTFTLREGVTFHDGTDFNAEAVVTNFEKWMSPSEENAGKYAVYATLFGGYKGDEGHVIDSVVAKDESTVVFTLNQVQPLFLDYLTNTALSIGSPTAMEEQGDAFGENPVGTGPFVFEEWKRNNRIVLSKNENYYLEGLPKLDGVIFRVIPDNSARLNALISGEIDIMDGLDPNNVSQIEADEYLNVFERPSMNTGYLGFTVTREPFDDPLVRQALSHAIDRESIIAAFYNGYGTPAKNIAPPSAFGFNDDVEAFDYDLEKAKALLEEAGYGDGFEMDLWAMPVSRPYMPDANKVAETIQASLAEIGVTANIQSAEWGTYLEDVVAGEYDSFLLGWTGDVPDANSWLSALLHKESIGSLNSAQYDSDEVSELISDARSTADQDVRSELYNEAFEILRNDVPLAPIVHAKPVLAGGTNVVDFFPHATSSSFLYKTDLK